jgi:hypothetical protein|tara:strand:+ start:1229 stop:1462 length:234 start_codon:yes stop_codon:yes gene_type:complete
MIDILEIDPGNSYACKFRVTSLLMEDGRPYESLGVLIARDADSKLVRLEDTKTKQEFVVEFDNIWDIDDVEWVDEEE